MSAALPSFLKKSTFVLLLLLLAAPVRAMAAAVDAGASGYWGLNMLWGPAMAAAWTDRLDRARALGVRLVRVDWPWREVEGTRGAYDWRKTDLLARLAAERGIALLPMVMYAPDWALVARKTDPTIYQMGVAAHADDAYAAFVRASVERYPAITSWEIWNEPNLKYFWGPAPEPARYAALLAKTALALGDLRSRITLVHAGLAGNDAPFLAKLYDANPRHGDHFDVMSVHPYIFKPNFGGIRGIGAIESSTRPDLAQLGFLGGGDDIHFFPYLYNVQLVMALRDRVKPIWITEFGAPVGRGSIFVTPPAQAQLLVDAYRYACQYLRGPHPSFPRAVGVDVQRFYWFSLDDYPSPDGMGSFGIYDPQNAPRPAALQLRDYLAQPLCPF